MIKKVSDNFAQWLVQNGSEAKDFNVISYSIESLLNYLLIIGACLIIGTLTGRIIESLIWLFSFITLRHYVGGFHAMSHLQCFFLSLAVFCFCIFIFYEFANVYIILFCSIFALITVWIIAPVIKNKDRFSPKEFCTIKNKARIIISILVCAIIALCLFNEMKIASIICSAVFSVSLTALIGKLLLSSQ